LLNDWQGNKFTGLWIIGWRTSLVSQTSVLSVGLPAFIRGHLPVVCCRGQLAVGTQQSRQPLCLARQGRVMSGVGQDIPRGQQLLKST
jgi:hypothetical protein